MKGPIARILLAACLFALSPLAGAAPFDGGKLLVPGDFFPDHRFPLPAAPGDRIYLGVDPAANSFTAASVDGDLLVLEMFNAFCFGCQQNAPLMAETAALVGADPTLATRVRMLGVGLGNNAGTLEKFRATHRIPFPLLPDPGYSLFAATGNPGGTPYTLFLRRTPKGLLLLRAHFGVMDSAQKTVAEIRELLGGEAEKLAAAAGPVEKAAWTEKELKPEITPAQLAARVSASMARGGYQDAQIVERTLPSGEKLWEGTTSHGKVFTRLISRLPVCDVCHPLHFLLSFDAAGQVVDFDSLNVTKYWNVPLTPEEVALLRGRLLGKSVLETAAFDPGVDAVATATISSSLIFDSVGRTGEVHRILKEKGWL